jgi:hypothetical protein
MTYSYTEISQYLTCPRRYRHRYLDGWQEKEELRVVVQCEFPRNWQSYPACGKLEA